MTLNRVLDYGEVLNVPQADERNRVVERKEVMLFEEVDDKSNKIIEFCTDPKSTKEIMEYLGFKERKSAFKYLRP